MTSIFSPRRTKSSLKGGAQEAAPEAPATLATAHAAAFVKAKRDGDLLVTTHVEEKKGKEMEHIVQILRFGMKSTGEQVLQRVFEEFSLDKKRAEKERLVPFFPSGGVFMDLQRPLEQYVMGTTETLHLLPFKKPRGTLLVILYELGKVEQIDVWAKTTVLGVLMAITAKTENTVNECILCTPEPVQELALDALIPKGAQKLVFLKRSRVTDKAPSTPHFPSRTYLIETFNAKFHSTMYVPPDTTTTTSSSSSNAPLPETTHVPESVPEPQRVASLEPPTPAPAVIDVSAYVAPTTPAAAPKYTHHSLSLSHSHQEGTPREESEADTEADSEGSAPPPSPKPMPISTPAPVPVQEPAPLPPPSPTLAPVPMVDVRSMLQAESDATKRYAQLIALLESEPIPEPRVVAATFKEWFTKDAPFKAYFNALGAVRVASLLKNVANALKA